MKYMFLSAALAVSSIPASNAATITEFPGAKSAFDQYETLALEHKCQMELAKGEQTTDEVDEGEVEKCVLEKEGYRAPLFPTPKGFN